MKKPLLVILICAIVAAGTVIYAYFFIPKPKSQSYDTTAAQIMDLQQTVSADGTVTASTEDDLGFQTQGQINAINVGVGDTVTKGETLASLDQSSLNAQLQTAEANLQMAQLSLQELTNATTTAGSAVVINGNPNNSGVQTTISNTEEAFENQLVQSYDTLDTALSTYIDNMFSSPRTGNPIFGITLSASNGNIYYILPPTILGETIDTERHDINTYMTQWKMLNEAVQNDSNNNVSQAVALQDIAAAFQSAEQTLEESQTLLANIDQVFATYDLTNTSIAATYAGYEGALATARTNVDTTLSSLKSANAAFQSAQTPTSPYSTAEQSAAVTAAQASVAAVEAQIAQSVIVAPINGIITEQNGNVGEAVSANTPIIHLISNTPYQVDVYVSEDSIGSIALGQLANVTLPAYGTSVNFPASVVTIDPGQTLINGVGMYKVTLQFNQTDPRIKDGMSATADIITVQDDNVLAVPQSAVLQNNGSSSVLLFVSAPNTASTTAPGAQVVAQPVQTGITGGNGWTEITSGLVAGQQVATFGNQ